MDFAEIIKRVDRDLYDGFDKGALPKLVRFLERAKGMAPLLKQDNPVLAAFAADHLLKLGDIYRQFASWKEAYRNTKRVLATSKLALPDQCLQNTAFAHELAALERTARMCQRSGYPDVDSWAKAVNAHLALWNGAVELGLKETKVTVTVVGDEADEFSGYCCSSTSLHQIRHYNWLGARRGEAANQLQIALELPTAELVELATAHLPEMGLAARNRPIESLVEELVTNNLPGVLIVQKDNEAKNLAVASARNAFGDLLEATPVETDAVVSIYVGRAGGELGVALVGKNGALQEGTVCASPNEAVTGALGMAKNQEVSTFVLPVSAPDMDGLRQVEEGVSQSAEQIVRVLPAAMAKACAQIPDAAPRVASAVVLARRALAPVRAWAQIKGSDIGVGEFPTFLDEQLLDDAFLEVRLLQQLINKRGGNTGGPKPGQKKRRLNPLVRSIRDLKPGMTLDGIITNLTKFGAFVNVGLATEAMIHVSQLSTDFIEEPSQVVSIGQTVNARVLEVIPEKGRIALSLKPATSLLEMGRAPMGDRQELQRANDAAGSIFSDDELSRMKSAALELGNRRPDPRSRSAAASAPNNNPSKSDPPRKSRGEALADLDALFKK